MAQEHFTDVMSTKINPVKTKILFIVNVDWFFVSHRLPIALELLNQGYEVHVACGITDRSKYLESLGLIVHKLPVNRSGLSIQGELYLLFTLNKVIRLVSADIVHLVTIKPVIYGGILTRFRRFKRRVASISGLGFVFTDNGVKARIIRALVIPLYKFALNKRNTHVIFQNNCDKELFLHNGIIRIGQEVLIKGSGVDLERFLFVPEQVEQIPIVMFLARLLYDKGIKEFCEAARMLKNKNVKARFVLVGDFDKENPNSATKSELTSYIKNDIVEWWGHSKDVANVIPKCNIMVLPSYREGMPKSLLETAACGRAVITTDVPGCRDAIIENETGLLVEARSALAIVSAVESLLNNTETRLNFAHAGRRLAEQVFDVKDVVKRHIDIYEGNL